MKTRKKAKNKRACEALRKEEKGNRAEGEKNAREDNIMPCLFSGLFDDTRDPSHCAIKRVRRSMFVKKRPRSGGGEGAGATGHACWANVRRQKKEHIYMLRYTLRPV